MVKRPTLKSIAAETELSVGAVSYILNGKGKSIGLSDSTISKTLSHAKKVGYIPHIQARNLRLRQTGVIGVIFHAVENHNEDLAHRLFLGLAKAARLSSRSIVFFDVVDEATGEAAIQQCMELNVDGIIARHIKIPGYLSRLRHCIEKGMNTVMLLNSTDDCFDCPNVVVDDFFGGFLATKHLISKGCSRIAHLANRDNLSSAYERCRGYKAALEASGIPYREDLVVEVSPENDFEDAVVLSRLEVPPDGVFCHNDVCALHAGRLFADAGVDIELIGFDNRDFIQYLPNPFDTVDMPLGEVGGKAVELLFSKKRETVKHKIKPTLILRDRNNLSKIRAS